MFWLNCKVADKKDRIFKIDVRSKIGKANDNDRVRLRS